MSLVSNSFILFVLLCIVIYYIAPKKSQWVVLLGFSYVYYIACNYKATLFLIASTVITYGVTRWMEWIQKKEKSRQVAKKRTKKIMLLGILSNLGILAFLKYTNFTIENINIITHGQLPFLNLILPLGISYYTFQTVGYVLDVYWGKVKAQHNIFKLALFVSFFPQLAQGPIGRYEKLAPQLYTPHDFSTSNIKFGLERILWGVFKKMIIGDWAAIFADAIFKDPDKYAGIAAFGVILYAVELYGNFSGGIDIIIGVANLFGITMDENFIRPYFATSLSDYWRRWHITLGTWMKDYVFYPLSISKAMRKCGKIAKKIFGKRIGRTFPICIVNIIVFFIVGIWHGASWNNIGWGLYNGIIIGFSGMFAQNYVVVKNKFHINDKSKGYHVFMILRTFIIVCISLYFDRVSSFGAAFKMIGYSLTRFEPSQFLMISSGKLGTAFTPYALLILGVSCILLFCVSLYQENGGKVRQALSRLPLPAEFAICCLVMMTVPLFSPQAVARGFIYAQF